MLAEIKTKAEDKMTKSIDNMRQELIKLRTGRAHPNLLDHIKISYYDHDTPLNQVANISILDARTLQVIPFERSLMKVIEKAILKSDLGLNPTNNGNAIRIPLPPLNQERRKELIRMTKTIAENTRIMIRNIRRDANESLKRLAKNKEITDDQEHRGQTDIQKSTDQSISEIEKIITKKEYDLMEI